MEDIVTKKFFIFLEAAFLRPQNRRVRQVLEALPAEWLAFQIPSCEPKPSWFSVRSQPAPQKVLPFPAVFAV